MKWCLTRSLLWTIALLLTGVGALRPITARAAESTWESQQFDFGVQWQAPWIKVKDDSVSNDYDMVEIKAGDDPIWQDIYGLNWTESDPTAIAHKFVARFRDGFSDLKVTQEWSAGGSTGAFPEIITYTAADGLPITEAVVGRKFDAAPGVFLFTYRRSGDIDPMKLRELDRLITVRYPGDPVLPTPVVTPSPTATEGPTENEIAAAHALAETLRASDVSSDELGGYNQYGGVSLEPDTSGPASEDVYFSTGGPAHLQDFGYWIYPNSAVARSQFTNAMTLKQAKDFPVRIDVSTAMGPDSWLLTDSSGYTAGCFVLVDNVVALGTAVGGPSFAPSTAIACDMARIAVIHLARFAEDPNATTSDQPPPDQPTPSTHAAVHIRDMLPTSDDVPAGLVIVAEATRTLEEVAANYQDSSDLEMRFTKWHWKGNVTRTFGVPAGGNAAPDETVSIYVSIHRFGNAEFAGQAFTYSFDDQLQSTGASETQSPALETPARSMTTATAAGAEATVYVQDGSVLIRVTVMSIGNDPSLEANAIAAIILAK